MEPVDEFGRVDDVPRPAKPWNMMQAAAFLGVSQRSLKRWIEEGMPVTAKDPFPVKPPYYVIGGRYKFDPGELRSWRNARKGAA